ncbi:MAG: VanZ family protein, partial [Saccharofermentanales bacterium]
MRPLNIISLANEYFFIGFIGSLILCSIFLLFWFILYKRILKGTKDLPKKKVVLALISICYMSLIIGIVFIRQSSSYHSVNLHLFRSYREAWNTFSVYEWTNLVLNILIFVPLGFLLPLWSDKLRKLWKVILISVSISAAIECIQYITHHGVFDIDDIFNNSTGSLIGYGFVMIILTITHTEKRKWIKAAGYCLPFLAVLTA